MINTASMQAYSLSSQGNMHHYAMCTCRHQPLRLYKQVHTPVFDHALQGLPIEVVCDVKVAQHMKREGADVYHVLVNVECPYVPHVKHLLLVQRRMLEFPAVLTT